MNYQNTKIYKIESHQGNKIYIGSTTKKYLSQRMDKHRYEYKEWKKNGHNKVTSYILFEDYGVENCFITLLESFPCNSKDEAHAREAHYIRSLDCVNKCIPTRTGKEYKDDNKEKFQAYNTAYQKQYSIDNKEYLREYKREWAEKNKARINEHKESKYVCACGIQLCLRNKARHEKSKYHIENTV